MKISLKNLLEGVTAIPYSDELINILENACLTYKNDKEFERVDELVVGYINGKIPILFKNHINKSIIDQGFYEVPTNEVLVCLSLYVVINTILYNDDNYNKAICTSKLMNYMLMAKALRYSMPNIDIVPSVYSFHLSKFIETIDNINENSPSELCSTIPTAKFPLEITNEQSNELRWVFKEAELYRIEHLLTSSKIQDIENIYVRVYKGLYNMFEILTYYFYNLDLNRIIRLLLNDDEDKKSEKLSNIINDLQRNGCECHFDSNETSIILSMLKGEKLKYVGDLNLSIKEFAVYLYYEILTEKIIATKK